MLHDALGQLRQTVRKFLSRSNELYVGISMIRVELVG